MRAMRKTTKVEGVDYVLNRSSVGRDGHFRKRKPSSEEIERRVRLAEETQRISDELRRAAGLEPIAFQNSYRTALYAKAGR